MANPVKIRSLIGPQSLPRRDLEDTVPVSEGAPYPRYLTGEYELRCQGAWIYRDRRWGAWKVALKFTFLGTNNEVWGFMHLGRGDVPQMGRGSRYWRAWVIATGEQPKKRQRMSPRVFTGKNFLARIADCTTRGDGLDHPEAAQYSVVVVKDLLKRTWP